MYINTCVHNYVYTCHDYMEIKTSMNKLIMYTRNTKIFKNLKRK